MFLTVRYSIRWSVQRLLSRTNVLQSLPSENYGFIGYGHIFYYFIKDRIYRSVLSWWFMYMYVSVVVSSRPSSSMASILDTFYTALELIIFSVHEEPYCFWWGWLSLWVTKGCAVCIQTPFKKMSIFLFHFQLFHSESTCKTIACKLHCILLCFIATVMVSEFNWPSRSHIYFKVPNKVLYQEFFSLSIQFYGTFALLMLWLPWKSCHHVLQIYIFIYYMYHWFVCMEYVLITFILFWTVWKEFIFPWLLYISCKLAI